MAATKLKGDLGEAMVLADVMKRGYKVALPVGEDWPYDLIVLRAGRLERVQCKYVESNGSVISVKCRSTNNWNTKKYTSTEIDWIAVYDRTTERCFYVPAAALGDGRAELALRLKAPKNNQIRGIIWAKDYELF